MKTTEWKFNVYMKWQKVLLKHHKLMEKLFPFSSSQDKGENPTMLVVPPNSKLIEQVKKYLEPAKRLSPPTGEREGKKE